MRMGIMIPVFDRPEYFQQTINTLLASTLHDCMVCIVDDGSKSEELKRMYRFFIIQNVPMIKIVKGKNIGMWDSMKIGFDALLSYGCDILINLDSDTLVKPNWVIEMIKLHKKFPKALITGFNNNRRAPIKEFDKYYQRESAGGVSHLYSKKFYNEHVKQFLKDDLWDNNLGMYMIKNKLKCYSTKPSVVQHIGITGKNCNPSSYDTAVDWK